MIVIGPAVVVAGILIAIMTGATSVLGLVLIGAVWFVGAWFVVVSVEVDQGRDVIRFVRRTSVEEYPLSEVVRVWLMWGSPNRYFLFANGKRIWTPQGLTNWDRMEPVLSERVTRNIEAHGR